MNSLLLRHSLFSIFLGCKLFLVPISFAEDTTTRSASALIVPHTQHWYNSRITALQLECSVFNHGDTSQKIELYSQSSDGVFPFKVGKALPLAKDFSVTLQPGESYSHRWKVVHNKMSEGKAFPKLLTFKVIEKSGSILASCYIAWGGQDRDRPKFSSNAALIQVNGGKAF